MNSDLSDIAAALTQSISADGQTPISGILKFPSGTSAAPAFTFSSDLTSGMYLIPHGGANNIGISSGGAGGIQITTNVPNETVLYNTSGAAFNPIGMIVDFAGTTAPTGWFLCFGQSLSAAAYPELFAILGTTYGVSGGNVVLPDCRGRVTAGKDNMGGSAANRITAAGGNFDGTVLGGVGGQQNKVIANGNLPASIPLTDPGHNHVILARNINDIGALYVIGGATGGVFDLGVSGGKNSLVNTNTTGITINAGGANTALPVLSPIIIFNKIIFAGRP